MTTFMFRPLAIGTLATLVFAAIARESAKEATAAARHGQLASVAR